MESLSEILSPLDNIELICEEHGIPCIGLCAEYFCKDKPKFLCMKCIKSNETCITKEKHELVSFSEFLYRFFIKEENKIINLIQIQSMNKLLKEISKDDLNKSLHRFMSLSTEIIDKIDANYKKVFKSFFDKFNENNKKSLTKLREYSQSNNENEENINLILNTNLPEMDENSDNSKKLEEFMNDGFKLNSPKEFINSIKMLNNVNKFSEITDQIQNKIYIDKVSSATEEKKKKLSDKIDIILGDLEKVFDKTMSELEKQIIVSKDNQQLYTYNKNIENFISNPNLIEFKEDLATTAHKTNSIDRVFTAFKSLLGEFLLVWGTPQYSIECLDLDKGKIIKTIPTAHAHTIFCCRHYADKKERVDYIITTSYDRKVKIWNIKNWNCVINIQQAHKGYYIYTACLLFNENEKTNYVISSAPNEFSKIWDFNGKFLRDFGVDDESTYFIDTYFDYNKNIHYIINANSTDVKSYVFSTGKLYKSYRGTPKTWHMSAVVAEIKGKLTLVESDGNGYVRLWEFHTGLLIKSISPDKSINLRGICLWNENYLFGSGSDFQIKLIDINNGKFVKSIKAHTSTVCTLEKIMHPKYGESLISQGLDGKLKLWITSQSKGI